MNKINPKNILKTTAIGILIAVTIFAALVAVFSFMVLYSNLSPSLIPQIATIIGAISMFSAVFIITRIVNKKGLLIGAIFGLVSSIIIILMTFFLNDVKFSVGELTKIIIIFISSCLGGIFGVNSKG